MRLRDYVRNTLFNTHISYRFHFNEYGNNSTIELNACHPIAKEYDTPNSIYCYSETDFGDLLRQVYHYLGTKFNKESSLTRDEGIFLASVAALYMRSKIRKKSPMSYRLAKKLRHYLTHCDLFLDEKLC